MTLGQEFPRNMLQHSHGVVEISETSIEDHPIVAATREVQHIVLNELHLGEAWELDIWKIHYQGKPTKNNRK